MLLKFFFVRETLTKTENITNLKGFARAVLLSKTNMVRQFKKKIFGPKIKQIASLRTTTTKTDKYLTLPKECFSGLLVESSNILQYRVNTYLPPDSWLS